MKSKKNITNLKLCSIFLFILISCNRNEKKEIISASPDTMNSKTNEKKQNELQSNRTKQNFVNIVKSGPITKVDAQKLRDEYNTSTLALQTSMSNRAVSLQGFVFDADDLREILDRNTSKIKPDSVIFYFGKEPGLTLPNVANWHIIAYGMKGKQLLDFTKTAGKAESIKDKADPCPPNCPNP